METNIGAFDGYFRTLLFMLAIIFATMAGQWIWLIPTALLFATAVLTWCPLYAILGISTSKPAAIH